VIKGEEFDIMKGVAEDVQYYIEDLESIRRANISASSNRPEVHLYFNQILLTEYGITLANVASELGSFSREFTSGVNFKQGTEEYEIIVKQKLTEEEEEENPTKGMEDLQRLQIRNAQGATYDLKDIADLVYASGTSSITRIDQEKQIELRKSFVEKA